MESKRAWALTSLLLATAVALLVLVTSNSAESESRHIPGRVRRSGDGAPQRVRYEVRDLTSAAWRQVVDALWVMKTTTNLTEGRALYG